jgi:hypothetical protein
MPAQTIQFDGTNLNPIEGGCLNRCCKVFSFMLIHTLLSFQQLVYYLSDGGVLTLYCGSLHQ